MSNLEKALREQIKQMRTASAIYQELTELDEDDFAQGMRKGKAQAWSDAAASLEQFVIELFDGTR